MVAIWVSAVKQLVQFKLTLTSITCNKIYILLKDIFKKNVMKLIVFFIKKHSSWDAIEKGKVTNSSVSVFSVKMAYNASLRIQQW